MTKREFISGSQVPTGRRFRGRPSKRRMYYAEGDLRRASVTKLRETIRKATNDTVLHCGGQRTPEGVDSTGVYD